MCSWKEWAYLSLPHASKGLRRVQIRFRYAGVNESSSCRMPEVGSRTGGSRSPDSNNRVEVSDTSLGIGGDESLPPENGRRMMVKIVPGNDLTDDGKMEERKMVKFDRRLTRRGRLMVSLCESGRTNREFVTHACLFKLVLVL